MSKGKRKKDKVNDVPLVHCAQRIGFSTILVRNKTLKVHSQLFSSVNFGAIGNKARQIGQRDCRNSDKLDMIFDRIRIPDDRTLVLSCFFTPLPENMLMTRLENMHT
jgi:hypothetical protein